jgi:hypothetical protein
VDRALCSADFRLVQLRVPLSPFPVSSTTPGSAGDRWYGTFSTGEEHPPTGAAAPAALVRGGGATSVNVGEWAT